MWTCLEPQCMILQRNFSCWGLGENAMNQGRPSDFESGGGGHQEKRALSGKKGTYKGKSHSESIQFFRHWYIPLHCDYNYQG